MSTLKPNKEAKNRVILRSAAAAVDRSDDAEVQLADTQCRLDR